jgi:hypothetical protein
MTEDKKTEFLLEQYKLYVEMTDNVSARRSQTNAFYITALAGLLAVLSLTMDKIPSEEQYVVLLAAAVLGILLCYIWFVNIRSYRQLNFGKFAVIHEMEQQLPYCCYAREWEILGKGVEGKKYLELTRVERYVPVLLATPYVLLLVYSLDNFLR